MNYACNNVLMFLFTEVCGERTWKPWTRFTMPSTLNSYYSAHCISGKKLAKCQHSLFFWVTLCDPWGLLLTLTLKYHTGWQNLKVPLSVHSLCRLYLAYSFTKPNPVFIDPRIIFLIWMSLIYALILFILFLHLPWDSFVVRFSKFLKTVRLGYLFDIFPVSWCSLYFYALAPELFCCVLIVSSLFPEIIWLLLWFPL